jgi:hypothetical protein
MRLRPSRCAAADENLIFLLNLRIVAKDTAK